MKYKLVIFDFDGTLADSFPWFLRIINDVAEKYRFRPIEDHEIEALRGYDNRKIIEHLKMPVWKMPFVTRYMRKIMTKDIHGISLFPGVNQMLRNLIAGGLETAIVTSNSTANVRTVLGPENTNLIKYYACGARLFGKPAKIKKVLRWSGVNPAEAICVGDEIRDLQAAHSVGAAFGAVSWGYARPESFTPLSPEEVFLNISDIVVKLTK
ncbi:MAG TPA: HAD hydrolase-like protein [Pyrinomonadaceae bacterium]|jgi:phosphoglycolate phosphatase